MPQPFQNHVVNARFYLCPLQLFLHGSCVHLRFHLTRIIFNGEDVTNVSDRKLRELREKMQIIFQDPFSSLNPRMTARETIEEPLLIRGGLSRNEINQKVNDIMDLVGIDRRIRNAYPHELDGGRRQRVGIARALVMNPEFVLCDEPVSALDVSIQAQVINLLEDLQKEMKLSYLFITHDLSVVRYLSDVICVMYLGQVVELCETDELFENPMHPYTKALLSAILVPNIHAPMKHLELKGEVVSPIDPKPGCRFAARCPHATEACHAPQELVEARKGHQVLCCRVNEII